MQLSFHQWLIALKRHRLLSIFLFIGVMAVSVLAILFAPRSYSSEAKLMLRIGQESISVDPTASTVGETLNLHHTRENAIQSAVGVMRSREIVQRVVQEVGEDVVLSGKPRVDEQKDSFLGGVIKSVKQTVGSIDPVPDQERATRKLEENIFIGSTNESSVVNIAYTTDSPQVAQQVVGSWVENYILQHARANNSEGSLDFFVEQSEVLKDRLMSAREQLEKSKNSSSLVTVIGQQQLLENQVAKVREDLLETESQLVTVTGRVDAYQKILDSSEVMITSEVTGKTNEARDRMRSQLFDLEVQVKDLESRLSPDHPRLVSIRKQRDDALTILNEQGDSFSEVTQTVNPAYQKIAESQLIDRAEIKGLTQKQEMLVAELNELAIEIRDLNANERKIESLKNDVVILEGRFADHALKTEQARMKDVLANERLTSVAVVQPATLQYRPVSPNKPLCAIVGLFAATALALGLPLLIETRRGLLSSNPGQWDFDQREADNQYSWTDKEGERTYQPAAR